VDAVSNFKFKLGMFNFEARPLNCETWPMSAKICFRWGKGRRSVKKRNGSRVRFHIHIWNWNISILSDAQEEAMVWNTT